MHIFRNRQNIVILFQFSSVSRAWNNLRFIVIVIYHSHVHKRICQICRYAFHLWQMVMAGMHSVEWVLIVHRISRRQQIEWIEHNKKRAHTNSYSTQSKVHPSLAFEAKLFPPSYDFTWVSNFPHKARFIPHFPCFSKSLPSIYGSI